MAQQNVGRNQNCVEAVLHHGEACPYAFSPLPDCYCRRFNARTIPVILRYCGGEYTSCPIYRPSIDSFLPVTVLGSEVTP